VQGASDAPREHEQAWRIARALYGLHLAFVLLWLQAGPGKVASLAELAAEAGKWLALFAGMAPDDMVRRLEAMWAARAGVRFAVACNSATTGLVMAAGALGLGPGDEVLVPCMSFVASATAVVPFGCTPVFVEVKPDTLCIDPADAAAKITPRTKAIVAVHLGGSVADMDALLALGLPVIEDCAQAPGALYRGREAGSIGSIGVYSLTESKSITCGSRSSGSPAADNAFSRSSLSKNPGCPAIAHPHSPACNGPLPGEKPPVFTGFQSITPPR